MENPEKVIEEIVDSLYQKAINDFLIGYHFKKIQQGDSLYPNLSDFSHHLPRIKNFWKNQLIDNFKVKENYNLKKSHLPLNIKKGELDRFLLLFKNTLDEFRQYQELISKWESKLNFFKQQFLKFL